MQSFSGKSIFLSLTLFAVGLFGADYADALHGENGRAEHPTANGRLELRALIAEFRDRQVPERIKVGGDPDWDYIPWNFRTHAWHMSGPFGDAVVFLDSAPGGYSEPTVTAVTEYGAFTYLLPNLGRWGGDFAIDVKGAGHIELGLQPLGEKNERGEPIYYLSGPTAPVRASGRLTVTILVERNPTSIFRVREAIARMHEQSEKGMRREIDYHLPGQLPKSYVPTDLW